MVTGHKMGNSGLYLLHLFEAESLIVLISYIKLTFSVAAASSLGSNQKISV